MKSFSLNPWIVGLILVIVGLIIIVGSVIVAYDSFLHYKPLLPKAESLDQAITNTTYELVNIVIKLGFLGIMIWGGGLILKYGVHVITTTRSTKHKTVKEESK